MKLHRQPIFHAHPSHLGQHLRLKQLDIALARVAFIDALVQRRRLTEWQVRSPRRQMSMVRRRRTVLLEERPTLSQCIQVALPGRDVLVRRLGKLLQIVLKADVLGIDDSIRTEGRYHSPLPSALPNLLVLQERIKRCVGGSEHLDVEALKESARTELRRAKLLVDRVVVLVGVVGAQAVLETKLLLESVVDPETRGCSAKQVVVLREDAPDLTRIGLLLSVRLRNTKRLHADSLRVQHAEDVVIRLDEECRRVRKRLVVCEPLWICMPMRADDR